MLGAAATHRGCLGSLPTAVGLLFSSSSPRLLLSSLMYLMYLMYLMRPSNWRGGGKYRIHVIRPCGITSVVHGLDSGTGRLVAHETH